MRVGIFVEVVKAQFHTGISRYVKKLVETLVSQNHPDTTYYLYYQRQPGEQKLDWLTAHKQVKHRPLWTPVNLLSEHPSVWWKHYLPLIMKLDGIDVFHGPNHSVPVSGKVPTVLTIHDIAYFYMKVHGEGLDRMLKRTTLENIARATHIVAVSESTASDIIREGAAAEKTSVIYQGYEPNPGEASESTTILNHPIASLTPYLLFIGTVQPRKNVEYLIDEFARVSSKIPHRLIIAGAPGESQHTVEQKIAEYGLDDKVLLTGFISDEERHTLYKHADIFLYPSLYEGFGLVILEAMSYGVPVITGNNSSLPEAAGDAGIKVDIETQSALGEAILLLINDSHLRQELIEKGLTHCHSFGWEDSARQMMVLYRQLAQN
jgi:glycosyltransferase involved in cell wall biosynthesis|tara:strand:+ start:7617 stop:8747 length:1131 start_codon:yes stop_codon:yes gene_type:complete